MVETSVKVIRGAFLDAVLLCYAISENIRDLSGHVIILAALHSVTFETKNNFLS